MSKVILIFLDAFSSKYLEKTSFLLNISKNSYSSRLASIFGFQAIGMSLITGTKVNTHKIWSDYSLKGFQKFDTSKFLKFFLKMADFIPDNFLRRDVRYVISRLLTKHWSSPNAIPIELLDFFEPSFDTKNDLTMGQLVTLFGQLRKYQKKYYVAEIFQPFERFQIRNLRKHIRENDFILVRFNSLDRIGHKFGPESNNVGRKIVDMDNMVRTLVNDIRQQQDCHLIILSDHGMSPLFRWINLFDELKDLEKFKMPDDYLLFLHSTVACFWFRNSKVRETIVSSLSKAKFGYILDKKKLESLGIDNIGYKYGELMFALREGTAFFPDYYWRVTPPLGMHGYVHSSYGSPILLIDSTDSEVCFAKRSSVGYEDIMPTILDLLNLPSPATCEGKSLVQKK